MAFNPNDHMMNLKGKPYLPVAARIAWFRDENKSWSIITEMIENGDNYSVFRATIMDNEGRIISTGTKREDRQGFPDYLEKAECVPLDCRILTKRGWKKWDEVEPGKDMTLAYNKGEGVTQWTKVLGVSVYKDKPIQHWRATSNHFELYCTQGHTFLDEKGELRTMEEANRREGKALMLSSGACAYRTNVRDVSKIDAAVLALVVGKRRKAQSPREYYDSKGEKIYARSKGKYTFLSRIFSAAGIPVKAWDRWEPGQSPSVYLPMPYQKFVCQRLGIERVEDLEHTFHDWPWASLAEFLRVQCGATAIAKVKTGTYEVGFRSQWGADLCDQAGMIMGSMVLGKDRKSKGTGGVIKSILASNAIPWRFDRQEDVVGDVWCPTTEYGSWCMKTGTGIAMLTGNTGAIGRALGIAGYGTMQAPEFDEGDRLADSPVFTRVTRIPTREPEAPPEGNQGPFGADPDMPSLLPGVKGKPSQDELAAVRDFQEALELYGLPGVRTEDGKYSQTMVAERVWELTGKKFEGRPTVEMMYKAAEVAKERARPRASDADLKALVEDDGS